MSMSECIICSDLFDGVERVMAAPCGHVYHSRCLLRWLDEQKSCPECRQEVLRENVLELYFNINSTRLADPIPWHNEIETLNTLLQESSMKASKLSDRNNQLSEIVKSDAQTINTYRQANIDLGKKLQESTYQLRNSMNELPHLKLCLDLTKLENEKLQRELNILESIKTIVTGSQRNAEEIFLEASGCDLNASDVLVANRLAQCCFITKQNLKQAIQEKNELRKEGRETRKDLGLTTSKLKLSNNKVQNLERKVQQLEKAVKKHISKNSKLRNSLNPKPSTSSDLPCPKQSKKSSKMTITVRSEKKRKRNVVLDKKKHCKQSVSPLPIRISSARIASRKKGTNSVSSVGYNSFVGHHNFFVRDEDVPTVGRSKKVSLVPTKKKLRKL